MSTTGPGPDGGGVSTTGPDGGVVSTTGPDGGGVSTTGPGPDGGVVSTTGPGPDGGVVAPETPDASGPATGRTPRSAVRWVPWVAVLAVIVGALAYGTLDDRGPSTLEDRADALAAGVRCPTCRSESALESQAASARAVRTDIRERLEAGQTDGEIRAYLVSRYGQEILLTPSASGVSALVWVLPVAGLVLALAGLGFAFRRWRTADGGAPTDDDRALVAEAMRRQHERDGMDA